MSQGRRQMGACLPQFPLDGSFEGKAGTWETLLLPPPALPSPTLREQSLGGTYPGDPGLAC